MQVVVIIIIYIFYFTYFITFVFKFYTMKESLTIRLDSVLLEFIKKEAKGDFRTVNNYVEMILLKYMIEQQQTENPGE